MSRDATLAIGIGVVLVAIVVAAAAGGFATTTTITSSGSSARIPDPSSDSSTGIVSDLREFGGNTIFGLRLSQPTREAHISIILPPECVQEDESGNETVRADGPCADLPAHGDLAGSGTTATGLRLAIVAVKVSQDCFEVLTIGETWPAAVAECEVQ